MGIRLSPIMTLPFIGQYSAACEYDLPETVSFDALLVRLLDMRNR